MKRKEVMVLILALGIVGGCVSQPPESQSQQSEIDDAVADLKGLSIDQFFEKSYEKLLVRNPEYLIELGIAESYEVGNDQLTNISDTYERETQVLQIAILDLLRTYDRSTLTPEQQVSYDVYEWFLEDEVRQHEFMYYDYAVTHFTTGIQNQMIQFFTDIHPVASKEDAENYIARLSQVDTKFEQLIEGMRLQEEAGVTPPRLIIQWTLYGVRRIGSRARAVPFYTAFKEKVENLNLSTEEEEALLAGAEQAINESVIPAFQALAEYLEYLESVAPSDYGVEQFPKGDEYYEYCLRHHTTTDMSVDEIYELGLQELERIHGKMRILFDELGYPSNESISQLYRRVAQDGGYVSGAEVIETYETLIEKADQNLNSAFLKRPDAEVIVIGGNTGGYYIPGSLDGSRPGAFYADTSGNRELLYGMPTLTYHETIPGHHYQISLAQELDLPFFRTDLLFTGYTEGWALYAEQLAWEMGFYQDDVYGNLGRLQYEAFRAARLVVDTGIHAKGWTFDEAYDYMMENVGFDSSVVDLQFEVSRYIAWPGQATAYKVGMLKILELREKAKNELGEEFDIKEFHQIVLGNGSMPLSILERVVHDYIDTVKESSRTLQKTAEVVPRRSEGLSSLKIRNGGVLLSGERTCSCISHFLEISDTVGGRNQSFFFLFFPLFPFLFFSFFLDSRKHEKTE